MEAIDQVRGRFDISGIAEDIRAGGDPSLTFRC